MKKFFSRFSTGPSQVVPDSVASPPPPPASPGNPKHTAINSSNVRSIAARFESFKSDAGLPPPPPPPLHEPGLLTPSSSIIPALHNIAFPASASTPSSSSALGPIPTPDLNLHRRKTTAAGGGGSSSSTSNPFTSSSSPNLPTLILNGAGPGGIKRSKDTRDPSAGSNNSASANSAAPPHTTKTVAFAPSPKKAIRSPILGSHGDVAGGSSSLVSSPGGFTGIERPSSSSSHGGGGPNSFSFPSGPQPSGMVSDGSDTDLRASSFAFAKPTAASLARAVRAASPQLSNASVGAGGPSSIHSKRISLPSRSLIEYSGGPGREGSVSYQSTGARSVGGPSWSEMTEDDLVMNLGPRERTRQEVLWEIVASEERYVHELQRTRLFYLEALLHPHRFSTQSLPPPPNSPPPASSANNDSGFPSLLDQTVPEQPVDLPIAARWMNTSTSAGNNVSSAGMNGQSPVLGANTNVNRVIPPSTAAIVQSSYRPIPGRRSSTGSPRMLGGALPTGSPGGGAASATRSPPLSNLNTNGSGKPLRSATMENIQPQQQQQSNHPLSRSDETSGSASSHSNNKHHNVRSTSSGSGKQQQQQQPYQRAPSPATPKSHAHKRGTGHGKKMPKFPTFPGSSQGRTAPDPLEVLLPVTLPTHVRLVLETISEGLLTEHSQLSDALKNRYHEQWPLVRSLADVFLRHSFLLKHYAVYVCHLERTLEFLEEAALMERAMRGKKIRKDKMTQTVAAGRAIAALEAIASERGEPGLALFISKPFQRLLKYPLLFQNLLFHTDPSTYEFESTVAMVVEVERIVRSIEDEKVSAEERDRTRDAFARIDGITDRAVLKPRPDRTLIEEKPMYDEGPKRALSESRTEKIGQTEAVMSELTSGPGGGPRTSMKNSTAASGVNGGGGQQESANSSLRAMLKSKRSFRRLSDFLNTPGGGTSNDKAGGSSGGNNGGGGGGGGGGSGLGTGNTQTKAPNLGSKRDLWIVRFSDVELRCQRTGTTTLPMVSSAALQPEGSAPSNMPTEGEEGVPDFASRSQYSKERLRALRNQTLRAKTRNLYKFVGVQSWKSTAPSAAAAAAAKRAEDVARAIVEVETDDEDDEDASSGSEEEEEGEGSEEDGPTESESSADEDGIGALGTTGMGSAGGSNNPDRFVREAKLSFS
ncbi:hypothetical protein OC861_005473, partial [Tilletia horrida]